MKIAFFSSEVFPFAKTGGLADVAGALPKALSELGAEVKVFMPLYKNIRPESLSESFGRTKVSNSMEVIFIKNDEFYLRDYLYNTPEGDYPDNLERFSFFCKKSLETLKEINFSPDILHCNDWQSSLAPVYLKSLYKNDPFFKKAKSILTIHNLAFQGYFPSDKFGSLGISEEVKDDLEIYGRINLLKGGIIYSDRINTVSPSYAEEIQTEEFGCGLDTVLRENRERLSGILNAIDYKVWSPGTDASIYHKYSGDSLKEKVENKLSLQKEFGLSKGRDKFLIGMVTRLAEQKGVDILTESLPEILKKYQVVILGTGEPKYHKILSILAESYPENFSLHLKFDETLAHKIYASSDVFLMPSRFEPCGLSQLISFKYAVLPLVKATGGLKDTVTDCISDPQSGTGFVFTEYSAKALIEKVNQAYNLFQDKSNWRLLQQRVSALNFSWKETAKKYLGLYAQA